MKCDITITKSMTPILLNYTQSLNQPIFLYPSIFDVLRDPVYE